MSLPAVDRDRSLSADDFLTILRVEFAFDDRREMPVLQVPVQLNNVIDNETCRSEGPWDLPRQGARTTTMLSHAPWPAQPLLWTVMWALTYGARADDP